MINAIWRFEVWEASLPGGSYEIRVLFRGKPFDYFVRPTMKEAQDAFEAAGYERGGALEGEHGLSDEAYYPHAGTWT